MKRTAEVLIVGGGVIGCSIAYFLRRRGVEVMVLERGDIGAQASSGAAGLLAPIRPLAEKDSFKALQLAGIARIASLVPELEDSSGVKVDYERTGTLRLLPLQKVALVQAWAQAWQHEGFHIDVLTPGEALEREPLLFPQVQGAVSIADEAQVAPRLLVQSFAQAARNLGAILYDHTEVAAIQPTEAGNGVSGIWTSRRDLVTCQHLIIAAGAWSGQVGAWLGVPFPVRPVRGELLALRQPSPSPIRSIIFDEGVFDEDIYLAPKPDGTVLVGATKSDVGFDTSVSAGGVLHLLDVATRLIPALAHCPIERMWACLRPKTPASHPILGPVPGWENVTAACGHSGFGVTLSAITGETIAEQVTTGQVPEIMRPFLPQGRG